jgi:hypothetical protein
VTGLVELSEVIVLGGGEFVHPRGEVGASVASNLVGQRLVHCCLDGKSSGEIVGAGVSVGRAGFLGKKGVQPLGESTVAFGHAPQHPSETWFAIDISLFGKIFGPGYRSGDLAETGAQCVDRRASFGITHRRYSRAPVLSALNVAAVRRGALICLVIATPAAVISSLLSDDDSAGSTDQSNWVFVALAAVVIAYLTGGAAAGRRATAAPFANGATATLSAFVVVQLIFGIVRLAQGDGLSPLGLIFNGLLAATIGVVGAGIGVWRSLRGTSPN